MCRNVVFNAKSDAVVLFPIFLLPVPVVIVSVNFVIKLVNRELRSIVAMSTILAVLHKQDTLQV